MKNANLIFKACVGVNKYESAGDKLRDKAFIDLFEREKDPMMVINGRKYIR